MGANQSQHQGRSLLDLANRQTIKGILVVTRSERWWGPLLGDYGHVDVAIKQGNQWIGFFPSKDMTEIMLIGNWRDMAPAGSITVWFRLDRKRSIFRCPHLLQPFTCVEQAKALLGIASPWILTPKQLYRRLRNG